VLQVVRLSLSQVQVELLKVIPTVYFVGSLGLTVPSLSHVQVELLKVKVSQQFTFFWCYRLCSSIIIPSTSRIVESKVSQQFTFSGAAGLVPSLSQVQVEVLKVKYPNSLLFWCCRLCGSIIIPSTSRIVESKVSVHFFWLLQVDAVPSLSQYK
jgi:hypothetical protein